jgi:hypothetical protein
LCGFSAVLIWHTSIDCYFCAAFLFYEPEKVPTRFHDLNADHQRMLDSLKASGLNWVAVLPPHLTGDNIFNILFQHPVELMYHFTHSHF